MNILITGTSSGIGYGLANEYLRNNAEVWGISRREPEVLLKNLNYHHLKLDLTNANDIKKMIPAFLSYQKTFDLAVLNSGKLGLIQLMHETTIKQMKEVFELNVWANKLLLDLIFDLGIDIKQVVGMSSKAALRSSPGWGSYSLSKAALDMLMNIYAKEYPETHFSAFAPGLVDTEITEYVHSIKNVDKYTSAKTLQEARYTDAMPDSITVAPSLIKGFEKALQYESGAHIDVREL